MKLSIETQTYNEKRYSKPWVASVTFSDNKPAYEFGAWVGDEGHAGVLKLDASIGDIVALGQKDNRSRGNASPPKFFIVQENGELSDQISKIDAFNHFETQLENSDDNRLSAFTSDELRAELAKREA